VSIECVYVQEYSNVSDGDELTSDGQSDACMSSPEMNDGAPGTLNSPKAKVNLCKSTTAPTLPSPSTGVQSFVEDNSWIYADSPQAAISQSVLGLVTDGSTPTMNTSGDYSGEFTVTQIYGDGYDLSTFDLGKYSNSIDLASSRCFDSNENPPCGGYSALVRIYKIIYQYCNPDNSPPCTSPCGCGAGAGGGSPGGGGGAGAGGSGAGGGGAGMGGSSGAGGGTNSGPSTMNDSCTISMNSIDDSSGGCSACSTGNGGLTYESRQSTMDAGYGSGWTDTDELPTLVVARNTDIVIARFGAEQADWFDWNSSEGKYEAHYGAKDTLVHDAANGLFKLTKPDGTCYTFYDADQTDPATGAILRPQGGLYQAIAPSGATIEVTEWTATTVQANGMFNGVHGTIKTVEYKTSPTGQAYQQREFTYAMTDDSVEHIQSITLEEYDPNSTNHWPAARKITYEYYADGDSYGLPGDLKKIVTQQYENGVASDYDTSDTDYFRYYTFRYYTGTGQEHLLERVVLANSYAKLKADCAAKGLTPEQALEEPGDPISTIYIGNYTCFYYEYDANARVTSKVVFGQSNQSTFVDSLSANDTGYNNWYRKSVETRLDNTTNTVFTNSLGQTLLTDLYDPLSQTPHTVTYNRYDDSGHLILTAEPSAIDTDVVTNGEYGYDSSQADLDVSFTADGLVYETVYYSENTAGGETAGSAAGYVAYKISRKADGCSSVRFASVSAVNQINLDACDATVTGYYEYYARTSSGQTIYPIASQTTYPDGLLADGVTTTYTYTWGSGFQIQQETTILPVVETDENGSGEAAVINQWYDSQGNLQWTLDALGRVNYYHYDALTDRMDYLIQDVNSSESSSLSPPTGCVLNSDGLNLRTDYQYDALGRVTQTLGPVHSAIDASGDATTLRTATWTVYKDAEHETRTAQGYVVASTSNAAIDGPISITITDRDGRTTDQIQAAYSDSETTSAAILAHLATATILQSYYTAWTHSIYKNTRLWATAVYYAIPADNSDSDHDGFVGSATENYTLTAYGYENFGVSTDKGRLNKTVAVTSITVSGSSPNYVVTFNGTITRYVLDDRGNVLETWMGTDDYNASDSDPSGGTVGQSGGNNMVEISSSTYDADGNLTSTTQYPGGSAYNLTTTYNYDWRDRLTDVSATADPANDTTVNHVITHYDYDNLGHVLSTKTYASDDFTLDAGELRAQTQNLYDALGRVYESDVYEIAQEYSDDPSPGYIFCRLPTFYWYDARGELIKTATNNGLFQKYAYDDLGRLVNSYTCYDTDEGTTGTDLQKYNEVLNVTGDTVIEQHQTWFDGAGEAVASATYKSLSGGATDNGPLDATNSYATASVVWYDSIGRVIETANLGREDAAAGNETRNLFYPDGSLRIAADGLPWITEQSPLLTYSSNTPDSTGDAYIVSKTVYDTAGRAYKTVDNLGRENWTLYDDAGRIVITIQHYDADGLNREISASDTYQDVDSKLKNTDTEQDITAYYQYDSAGRLATMVAYNAKGSGDIEEQATKYLYTSQVNASWQTGIIYPDSADSLSQDSYGVWTFIDPNGDLGDHVSTAYDQLGRTISTTDQRGVVHQYSFDSAGRLSADTVTNLGSSNNVDGSVRRIGTTYDDIGRVRRITNYSDTSGAVALNFVDYSYDGWGHLVEDWQSHTSTGTDPETTGYGYSYYESIQNGVAKYVRLGHINYPNPCGDFYYYYGTTGSVDDIMSRVERSYAAYTYLGASTIASEDYYGQVGVKLDYSADNFAAWDRFGRVVDQIWTDYGANPHAEIDHYHYTYDRAGNRTSRENVLKTDHSLDETYEYDNLDRLARWTLGTGTTPTKTWNLDSLGNDLSAGAYSPANEETPTQGSSGYDAAGNMTTLQSGKTAKYDAWNRLAEVDNISGVLEKYKYDGAGRRIQIFSSFTGSTPGTVENDYYDGQRLIESDMTVGGNPAGGYLYGWSQRYIDAPIIRDTLNTEGTAVVLAQHVFYLSDANYNITGLVKYDSGAGKWQVVERYTYDPYGLVTYRNPDWSTATSSANNNTVLYTGRTLDQIDSATALYYYRARYYDMVMGRFINRDPIKEDMNLYRYVFNKPISLVDPFGLCQCPPPPSEIASGEAVSVGDIDGDGEPDYKFPKELSGSGFTLYCYSNSGCGLFYVKAPDGSFVHRCPYGGTDPDGTVHPGGINDWKCSNKNRWYNGSVTNPETGEKICYKYWDKPCKLTITVLDKNGICIRKKCMDPPKKPSDLPWPDELPPFPGPK
jgi:RHS repeat-associated protein